MNSRQCAYFDGIRVAIEMIDVAYNRLAKSLLAISSRRPNASTKVHMAGPFLDAWSMVDSMYRLRLLIRQLPGVKKRSFPEAEVFIRETGSYESFRHAIQHLDQELKNMPTTGFPVWGTITWVTFTTSNFSDVRVYSITPGQLQTRTDPFDNPAGAMLNPPIDRIRLFHRKIDILLTDGIGRICDIVPNLEDMIAKNFTGMGEHRGSDVLVRLDIGFRDPADPHAGGKSTVSTGDELSIGIGPERKHSSTESAQGSLSN